MTVIEKLSNRWWLVQRSCCGRIELVHPATVRNGKKCRRCCRYRQPAWSEESQQKSKDGNK